MSEKPEVVAMSYLNEGSRLPVAPGVSLHVQSIHLSPDDGTVTLTGVHERDVDRPTIDPRLDLAQWVVVPGAAEYPSRKAFGEEAERRLAYAYMQLMKLYDGQCTPKLARYIYEYTLPLGWPQRVEREFPTGQAPETLEWEEAVGGCMASPGTLPGSFPKRTVRARLIGPATADVP